ncbi:MAG: hypothetical protein ACREF8_06285 [Chthoniobacterales bacterium]
MSTFEDYLFTKNTKWVLWGLGALLLAGLIFHAGVVVGSHEPVRYRGDDEGFHPPFPPFAGMTLPQGFIRGGYGAAGTITAVSLPTITIRTRDGATESIYVGTSTAVSGTSSSSPATLAPGEFVIVIGDPSDTDDNLTDARFIHVVPQQP